MRSVLSNEKDNTDIEINTQLAHQHAKAKSLESFLFSSNSFSKDAKKKKKFCIFDKIKNFKHNSRSIKTETSPYKKSKKNQFNLEKYQIDPRYNHLNSFNSKISSTSTSVASSVESLASKKHAIKTQLFSKFQWPHKYLSINNKKKNSKVIANADANDFKIKNLIKNHNHFHISTNTTNSTRKSKAKSLSIFNKNALTSLINSLNIFKSSRNKIQKEFSFENLNNIEPKRSNDIILNRSNTPSFTKNSKFTEVFYKNQLIRKESRQIVPHFSDHFIESPDLNLVYSENEQAFDSDDKQMVNISPLNRSNSSACSSLAAAILTPKLKKKSSKDTGKSVSIENDFECVKKSLSSLPPTHKPPPPNIYEAPVNQTFYAGFCRSKTTNNFIDSSNKYRASNEYSEPFDVLIHNQQNKSDGKLNKYYSFSLSLLLHH